MQNRPGPLIVFLDFDGPLFPDKVLTYTENKGDVAERMLAALNIHPFYTYWKADPFMVNCLNQLALQGFQCVVSSSWADDRMHSQDQIQKLFQANDIKIPLHVQWRTPRAHKNRNIQISDWLRDNPAADYWIFDDKLSGKDLLEQKSLDASKIVWIDEATGISEDQARQVLAAH